MARGSHRSYKTVGLIPSVTQPQPLTVNWLYFHGRLLSRRRFLQSLVFNASARRFFLVQAALTAVLLLNEGS